MPYCTLADIKKLLPEQVLIDLTDDERLGTVNQARIDEAIAGADAEIDGYCAVRYSVPFDPVPGIIKKFSVDIAIYHIYARKVDEMPEVRKTQYDNAVSYLRRIAEGKAGVGKDPEPQAATQGGAEVNKTTSDRIFTRDSLSGF